MDYLTQAVPYKTTRNYVSTGDRKSAGVVLLNTKTYLIRQGEQIRKLHWHTRITGSTCCILWYLGAPGPMEAIRFCIAVARDSRETELLSGSEFTIVKELLNRVAVMTSSRRYSYVTKENDKSTPFTAPLAGGKPQEDAEPRPLEELPISRNVQRESPLALPVQDTEVGAGEDSRHRRGLPRHA